MKRWKKISVLEKVFSHSGKSFLTVGLEKVL
nr:MAG TPA: hypothetical protein [Bacteriophage sp.]